MTWASRTPVSGPDTEGNEPEHQRVLVVDDDEPTRRVLGGVLDLEEFEACFVADGEAALARLHSDGPFEAVVSDMMMPGISGVELCRAVKASDDPALETTPVILLTAGDREDDRRAGLQAGADAYLTKPFSPLHLIGTIRSLRAERTR